MVKIKVQYDYQTKSFDIESDLRGMENRIIFAELIAGVTASINDLSAKMGIPKDMLTETFCGALTGSVLRE